MLRNIAILLSLCIPLTFIVPEEALVSQIIIDFDKKKDKDKNNKKRKKDKIDKLRNGEKKDDDKHRDRRDDDDDRRDHRNDDDDRHHSDDEWIPSGHRYKKNDRDNHRRRRGSNERGPRHDKKAVREYFISIISNYFSRNCSNFVSKHHDPVYLLKEDRYLGQDEISQLCETNYKRFKSAIYSRTSLREYLDIHKITVFTMAETGNYQPKVIKRLKNAKHYRQQPNDYIVTGYEMQRRGLAVAKHREFFVFIIRKTDCGYKLFGYVY
ncbi:MAG: hypothetical protein ABUK01_15455 [Leptospirales bacterium]